MRLGPSHVRGWPQQNCTARPKPKSGIPLSMRAMIPDIAAFLRSANGKASGRRSAALRQQLTPTITSRPCFTPASQAGDGRRPHCRWPVLAAFHLWATSLPSVEPPSADRMLGGVVAATPLVTRFLLHHTLSNVFIVEHEVDTLLESGGAKESAAVRSNRTFNRTVVHLWAACPGLVEFYRGIK
jgi:hypothetical protein